MPKFQKPEGRIIEVEEGSAAYNVFMRSHRYKLLKETKASKSEDKSEAKSEDKAETKSEDKSEAPKATLEKKPLNEG